MAVQTGTDTNAMAVETGTDTNAMAAEKVASIRFDGASVDARVISTGCTLLEHFTVEHEVRDDACYLTLSRTKPDYCRRAPFMMDVSVPWVLPGDCEALPVKFTNPLLDDQEQLIKPSTGRQLPRQ